MKYSLIRSSPYKAALMRAVTDFWPSRTCFCIVSHTNKTKLLIGFLFGKYWLISSWTSINITPISLATFFHYHKCKLRMFVNTEPDIRSVYCAYRDLYTIVAKLNIIML